jgi:ABC-type multidrug transport system fused ATPase/permease subunit
MAMAMSSIAVARSMPASCSSSRTSTSRGGGGGGGVWAAHHQRGSSVSWKGQHHDENISLSLQRVGGGRRRRQRRRAGATTTAAAPLATDKYKSGGLIIQDVNYTPVGAGVCVLERVNLTLAPTGLNLIVGRSGFGKSTLLSLVAGLAEPTAGRGSRGVRGVRGHLTHSSVPGGACLFPSPLPPHTHHTPSCGCVARKPGLSK